MQMKELGDKNLIETVDNIVKSGIGRGATTVRVRIGKKDLEVFEKYESGGPMKQVAWALRSVGVPIISRFKVLADLRIREHCIVQAGSYECHFKGTPVINIKVRIISIPNLDGLEEIIIDLVHN